MREILFRGKRVNNGEWVEGYLLEQNNPEYHCYIVREFKAEVDNRHIDILCCDIVEVIPETVGQYIEQKSYGEDMIFEGDILREVGEDNIGVVECEEAQYKLNIDNIVFNFGCIDSEWYEVIGNIHDNPELLEAQG